MLKESTRSVSNRKCPAIVKIRVTCLMILLREVGVTANRSSLPQANVTKKKAIVPYLNPHYNIMEQMKFKLR